MYLEVDHLVEGDRTSLSNKLLEENWYASVRLVSRRFYVTCAGEEEDREYPLGSIPPKCQEAHLEARDREYRAYIVLVVGCRS